MSDTRGMATTKVGDRVRITAVAVDRHLDHVVGAEYTVASTGRSLSGTIWIDVGGDYSVLVSNLGDRWTVLDGVDPGAAA
ncbi:MAG: hypothetical protein WKF93_11550 [Acidimicrobiales bacterium]